LGNGQFSGLESEWFCGIEDKMTSSTKTGNRRIKALSDMAGRSPDGIDGKTITTGTCCFTFARLQIA
jgi:hypothetical protein